MEWWEIPMVIAVYTVVNLTFERIKRWRTERHERRHNV